MKTERKRDTNTTTQETTSTPNAIHTQQTHEINNEHKIYIHEKEKRNQ